jgi:hypothetical protein
LTLRQQLHASHCGNPEIDIHLITLEIALEAEIISFEEAQPFAVIFIAAALEEHFRSFINSLTDNVRRNGRGH